MIARLAVLITVMVSWMLLATKTRLPSGEQTMFQGSAPVTMLEMTLALNVPQAGSLICITVTELPAALATYAYWLSAVSARLCGSSPTVIFARRVIMSGRKHPPEIRR